ncbi:MAG: peptidoglycan DD-metalloendopeptidase family protein, partial [Bacteroidota bacterium]
CIHRISALEALKFMVISQPSTKNDRFDIAALKASFESWATTNYHQFAPIIDHNGQQVTRLDLSADSFDHQGLDIFSDHEKFANLIDEMLREAKTSIGIGGYGERRNLYQSKQYSAAEGHRRRDTHLGFDIWAPTDSSIFAPLEGKVHSFKYDPAVGSYGATVILAHQLPAGYTFYTLYGHLSRASLQGLAVGQVVKTGQKIATLGDHTENGCWPPHLHFQVMLNDLGLQGDFPGVAFADEADAWLLLCPNPELMVKW